MATAKNTAFNMTALLKGSVSSLNITSGALAEALEQRAKEREKQATEVLLGILANVDVQINTAVSRLRVIRDKEKAQKAEVNNITRAAQYFGETNNPFPFLFTVNSLNGNDPTAAAIAIYRTDHGFRTVCRQLGTDPSNIPNEAFVIPQNWKPAENVELS